MKTTRTSCNEWIYILFIVFTLTGITKSSYSQSNTGKLITGVVSDDSGTTLPGASVMVKGTKITALTNNEGKYSIMVTSNFSVLVFSYVGMTTQEFTIESNSTLNVNLKSST